MTSFLKDDRSRLVAVWLFVVALMVFAMVVLGGATRLTGSGLSITEWKPVSGVLPPMSDGAWSQNFHLYQATPQYQRVNRGMSLGEFKFIFWWEWAHRLLGRLVGAAFGIPFVVFLVLKRIPQRLIWRCVGLFGLGGLQGAVGWWMVQSGLEARIAVAPERLATHLGLALVLLVALVWTGFDAWAGRGRTGREGPRGWGAAGLVLLGAVWLQCLLGALVAGNNAGQVDTDWPMMNGRVLPSDYAGRDLWQTLAHSQAAVQLHHRVGAYLIFLAALALAALAMRSRVLTLSPRVLTLAMAIAVLAQAGLGIATLMNAAPLALSIVHQAGAALLLTLATAFAWRVRRA